METAYFPEEVIEREICVSSHAIPFGLNDGKLVSVAQVDRGRACGCICPACESDLEAVKGDSPNSYRHHFRHSRRGDCDAGLETGLHMLAKEVLAQSHSLVIPDAFAKHGLLDTRLVKHGRVLPYYATTVEASLTESGKGNVRPDLIVEGEFGGKSFKLLVEIFVRHKTGPDKIAKLKERGVAAIEIDLSRVPAYETREFYEAAILRTAERYWLYNRHIEEERLRMRAEAERDHDHIATKIAAAFEDVEVFRPNAWIEPVTDAGLAELIGLKIDGNRCFATTAEIWQAAILHRHVLSPEHVFQTTDTLRWLADEDLLKPAFMRLLDADEGCLAHLRDCLHGFRAPHEVVSDYAGELVRRGKLQKHRGNRWSVRLDVAGFAVSRREEVVRWRLRLGMLLREFQAIKKRAIQGTSMDWEAWRCAALRDHGGEAPNDLIKTSEARFEALVTDLRQLHAMLEPNGNVPSAGLLGLPLEPERDLRLLERRERIQRLAQVECAAKARADEAARRLQNPERYSETYGEGPPGPKRRAPERLSRRSNTGVLRGRRWLEHGLGLLRALFRRRA